jgi:tellurium resistance protein TerD
MGVALNKGGNVNLSRNTPGLQRIQVGLGWDIRSTVGDAFDLDAMVFLLTEAANGKFKCRNDGDLVFFNNLKSPEGSVEHMGDNRDGAGDGDDEVVKIDLSRVPIDIVKIAIAVNIHDGPARRQNFGQVSSAFIRVVNQDDNAELARFDLSEDASTETTMVFGEVYRHSGEWKFKAVGQGYAAGLEAMCREYGLDVG